MIFLRRFFHRKDSTRGKRAASRSCRPHLFRLYSSILPEPSPMRHPDSAGCRVFSASSEFCFIFTLYFCVRYTESKADFPKEGADVMFKNETESSLPPDAPSARAEADDPALQIPRPIHPGPWDRPDGASISRPDQEHAVPPPPPGGRAHMGRKRRRSREV